MAKQTTKERLELTDDELLAALRAAGWPIPDAASGIQLDVRESGARIAVDWTVTDDTIAPTPAP